MQQTYWLYRIIEKSIHLSSSFFFPQLGFINFGFLTSFSIKCILLYMELLASLSYSIYVDCLCCDSECQGIKLHLPKMILFFRFLLSLLQCIVCFNYMFYNL